MNRYVIFVHGIHLRPRDSTRPEYVDIAEFSHLMVTKYSFLESQPFMKNVMASSPGNDVENQRPISNNEVVLECTDFCKMGSEEDAEVMQIRDIAWAAVVDTQPNVLYCAQPPSTSNDLIFCRLAWMASAPGSIVLSPMQPRLLPPRDRPKQICFDSTEADVIDLTPELLGPLEGFCEAGFNALAGLGFNPERHMTWKVCLVNSVLC